MTVWTGRRGKPPVAVVVDGADNPGVSAELVFPLLVRHVTHQLAWPLPGLMWVLRSEARAITTVLIGHQLILRDHLILHDGSRWTTLPLPGEVTRHLAGGPRPGP